MLLKIITNNGTTKIISDVEDFEMYHQPVLHYGSDDLLTAVYRLHCTTNTIPMGLEYYDSLPQATGGVGQDDIAPYSAQIIEYKKDGIWRKLAVHGYGYYCSDNGKTQVKIGNA